MKNPQKISIPNPCSESWDAMRINDSGRFCDSCQKTVIDFTKMSDEDFVAYFQHIKTAPCGKFTEKQLALDIPVKSAPLVPFWKMSKYVAASMIAVAGLTGRVFGQKVRTEQTSIKNHEIITYVNTDKNDSIEIKGTIVDEQNVSFPGVSISIKNLGIRVITDIDGSFTLSFPMNQITGKSFDLDVESLGYESSVIPVSIDTPSALIIKLRLSPSMLGGPIYYRASAWHRFRWWIKRNFI